MSILTTAILSIVLLFQPSAQTPEENVIHKTTPGKQLFQEDVQCGSYFWRSERADKSGAVTVYFFFGPQEYGKGKVGIYKQSLYDVVVNEDKDPPTAQIVVDDSGFVKSIKVQI